MKNILAVLLTLVLFCVPYALGLAVFYICNIYNAEPPIVYLFGIMCLVGIVSTLYAMYKTYLWIKYIIN